MDEANLSGKMDFLRGFHIYQPVDEKSKRIISKDLKKEVTNEPKRQASTTRTALSLYQLNIWNFSH